MLFGYLRHFIMKYCAFREIYTFQRSDNLISQPLSIWGWAGFSLLPYSCLALTAQAEVPLPGPAPSEDTLAGCTFWSAVLPLRMPTI